MTKRPTAQQVKFTWDATPDPSDRKVAAILVEAGYTVTYKTVQRYKKAGWAEPNADKPKRIAKKIAKVKSKMTANKALARAAPKEAAEGGQSEFERLLLERGLTRMNELYIKSVAENQKTIQQTALILGIVAGEEAVIRVSALIERAPGDLARVVLAVNEAAQAKHVGGEGQPPAADDPRVIDVMPNTNPVSQAITAFKKKNGLD